MNYTRRNSGLTTLIAICIAVIAPTALSQTNDEQAIRALSEQWQRDIAAQNVDRIVAIHTPDAIVMLSHTPTVKGSAAIRSFWSEAAKTPGLKLQWTPTKIDVVSPTVATE